MKQRFSVTSFAILAVFSLALSSCAPRPIATASQTPPTRQPPSAIPATSLPPTNTAVATSVSPTIIPTPSSTPTQMLDLSLEKGNFYFTVGGKQKLLFSRNPTGKTQDDFNTVLDWAKQAGTQFIRVHLTHGWWGEPWMLKDGTVNETWAEDWDRFFDQAQADGIYVMPVFGVWADWNDGTPDMGSPFWQYNPANQANGGPVAQAGNLFQPDSAAQKMWMEWVKTLVKRWQGRQNIAAWEIFSEINLASGAPGKTDLKGAVAESTALDFTNKVAAMIRSIDTKHRPLTVSLAVGAPLTDQWGAFYRDAPLDFIEIHPYSESLDREIMVDVQNQLSRYNKPVMIGESGLSAYMGDSSVSNTAAIGVEHAIWAGMVSGAMNARGFWWEDGYAIYLTDRQTALQEMQVYATAERPAVEFSKDVDFQGFKPLSIRYPAGTEIWGGAVGSETSAIGWFRDAGSEPLAWNLLPVISGQQVMLNLPGTATDWKVDFYDTQTGSPLAAAITASRNGKAVTIDLPDFKDAIAFKMTALAGTSATPIPPASSTTAAMVTTTDSIAGNWGGTIANTAGTFSTALNLEIQTGCQPGQICGKFSAPWIGCSGALDLKEITGQTFVFVEQNVSGLAAACTSGGYEYLQLQQDGTLLYRFAYTAGAAVSSTGKLKKP